MVDSVQCSVSLAWEEAPNSFMFERACFFTMSDAQATDPGTSFTLVNPPANITWSFDTLGNLTVSLDDSYEPTGLCGTTELSLTPQVDFVSINADPVLQDIADQDVFVGGMVSIQPAALDSDGDTLSWSATGLPAGVSVDPATGAISGSAPALGSYTITVTVSDGNGGSDSKTFTLTSSAATQCPGVQQQLGFVGSNASTSLPNQGSTKAHNGETPATGTAPNLDHFASASDTIWIGNLGGTQCIDQVAVHWVVPDGSDRSYDRVITLRNSAGQLVYTVAARGQAPANPTATGETISFPPVNAQFVRVEGYGNTENGATSTYTVIAEITARGVQTEQPNTAPVIIEVSNQTVAPGSAASIPAQATDAEGDTLSWSATGLPPGATINGVTGLISGTLNTQGSYTVTRTVSDGNDTDSETFTINVSNISADLHTPLFETRTSGATAFYNQAGLTLPNAVGQTVTQPHPTLDYEVRITRVNNANQSEADSGASYRPEFTKPEYAMHSAWDASGKYMVTHGDSSMRLLYDGQTYDYIRRINSRTRDFQWSPVLEGVAYFMDTTSNQVRSYNAVTNTFSTIYNVSTATTTLSTGGTVTGLNFPTSPMGNEGAISADGTRIAFRADDGSDGIIIGLDVTTGTVVGALRVVNGGGSNTGSAASAISVDRVGIAPDGSGVIFSFKHNGHNSSSVPYTGGPAVNVRTGEGDVRYYPFSDFRIANGDSSVSLRPEANHSDAGYATNGDMIFVQEYGETDLVTTGAFQYDMIPSTFFASGGTATPGAHVGMPDDGSPFVLWSGYGSKAPMVAFKAGNSNEVAFVGNPNPCNTVNEWITQPHATLSTNVEYADGIRGWKVAFTSDNNACGSISGGYFQAQAARTGGLFVAEIWRTDV